ncbi:HFL238Wp [Eremothecium sinecaudum]|uniref:HFL238Wp n=1 Tax=Eremothecium sinecaudum TaxID=45286 RepID=A0A109V009_9SACH|nr:HFL238Wp [Eremothecium sinecaudum]AMD21618.1 HFL238Wp [Eremothecium sinecaudum]
MCEMSPANKQCSEFGHVKPMLPKLATVLRQELSAAEGYQQSLRYAKFKPDGQGLIKLPPLANALPGTPYPTKPVSYVTPESNPRGVQPYGGNTLLAQSWTPIGANTASASPSKSPNGEASDEQRKLVLRTPTAPEKDFGSPTVSTDVVNEAIAPIISNKNANSNASSTMSGNNKRSFAFISHFLDTFLSQEPSIDNAPLARRKRRRTSKHELLILQQEFAQCRTPSKEKRIELANRCNMTEKAVQIWFQNRRQSTKKKIKDTTEQLPSTPLSADKLAKRSSSPLEDKTLRESSVEPIRVVHSSSAQLKTPKRPNVKHFVALSSIVATAKGPSPEASPCPTSQLSKGQALTFRLRSNKQLTPVQTSPNNRVNKLINGALKGASKATDINSFSAVTPKAHKYNGRTVLTPTNKNKINTMLRGRPLKELNINKLNT